MYKQFYGDDYPFALRAKLANEDALANEGMQEKHLRRPGMLHNQRTFRETIIRSTDPRDMVYSLLSLIAPEEAQIIGSDNRITTRQVYAKATYASFIVRKILDILFGKPVRSQPSVPRTIHYNIQSPELHRPYVRLDADQLTLRVTGQRFDTVKESMKLDANGRWVKSQFANAFFEVLRDLRMAPWTPPSESSPAWRMAILLKSTLDPDPDRWLSRILEESSATRKIVVGALLQYWT